MDAGYHTTDIISIKCPFHLLSIKIKHMRLKGVSRCGFRSLDSSLDKRQATLQLCIRAEGEQNVKPAIVFRGKGNVRADEKATMGVWMSISKAVQGWTVK